MNNRSKYTSTGRAFWVSVDNYIIPSSIEDSVQFFCSNFRFNYLCFVPWDYEMLQKAVHISAIEAHQWCVKKEGLQARISHVIQNNQLLGEEYRIHMTQLSSSSQIHSKHAIRIKTKSKMYVSQCASDGGIFGQ